MKTQPLRWRRVSEGTLGVVSRAVTYLLSPIPAEAGWSTRPLAESIPQHGLLNPVSVLVKPDGRYDLLASQSRNFACKHLHGNDGGRTGSESPTRGEGAPRLCGRPSRYRYPPRSTSPPAPSLPGSRPPSAHSGSPPRRQPLCLATTGEPPSPPTRHCRRRCRRGTPTRRTG
jgi:hypothetical protein